MARWILLILGPQKALLNLRRFRWFSEEPENFDYFCRLCLSATVQIRLHVTHLVASAVVGTALKV